MKYVYLPALMLGIIACLGSSCKKDKSTPAPSPISSSTRKIKFILYTNKDFSNDDHNIAFQLHIANNDRTFGFDSVVANFKVKDIPHKPNQLTFERTAP